MDKIIEHSTHLLAIEKGLCSSTQIPSQTTLQTRLRETHKIFVMVQLDKTMEPKFAYEIERFTQTTHFDRWNERILSQWLNYTYEDALEDGLFEALRLITIQDLRKEKLKKLDERKKRHTSI